MILIDATPLQTEHRYRGPGVYTASLLDALTAPDLITEVPGPLGLLLQPPRPDDHALAADLAVRPGVQVVRLHRPGWPRYRLRSPLGQLAVRPVLRRVRPRLYHATEPNGLVLVPGITTVATLYDLIPLHHPDAHLPPRRLDERLGYARYLQLLQQADCLIAISEATKRDAVERLHIPPERIAVIPLAVDSRLFYPRRAEEIQTVLWRHSLRRPYFLHVGASAYHKNTANLLRAFAHFCRSGQSEHALYIAGKWTERALESLQDDYPDLLAAGRLRVLGFVPSGDLPAFYSGADALLYPSLIEGFGLPVLEAMCAGTAVLTSTTSSLPEVGGDAALYVDPHDVEAMAAAMRRLAHDAALRADLIERGRRQAQRFSWTRTARETVQMYKRLL